MSKHGSIRRYSLIIEKLARKNYPTFSMIKEFLFDHGFELSDRTIQRDIEQIRYDFGIEITFDNNTKGYYIDEENSMSTEGFIRFLEIANTADLLSETLMDSKGALDYIEFESAGALKGLKYLRELLMALKNKRLISFSYKSFDAEKERTYQLAPYLLKEYQSRWYIIGMVKGLNEFRTFGIDRFISLQVLEETFIPNSASTPKQLFHNTIGLTYSVSQVEEVELSFTPFQGNYVKTLPWHHSQQIIADNDRELRIRLTIVPNFEFKQKVLMHGEYVKVIKPTSFAVEIKQSLENTLKHYK